jgi:hypothetical protein
LGAPSRPFRPGDGPPDRRIIVGDQSFAALDFIAAARRHVRLVTGAPSRTDGSTAREGPPAAQAGGAGRDTVQEDLDARCREADLHDHG